jgi:hypothetical protein
MNPRVTIGFVVALGILAAVVFGLDQFKVGQPTPTPVAAPQSFPVLTFDDSKVKAFAMQFGDRTARVERAGTAWVVSPGGEPANGSAFTSLMIRLSALTATSRAEGRPLADFGLNTPVGTATIELDDGSSLALVFGNRTPVQSGVYVKKGDSDEVYVVTTSLQTDIERLAADPKLPPTPTPIPSPTPVASPAATATP